MAAFTVEDVRLIKKGEREEKEEADGWDDPSDDDEEEKGPDDTVYGICKRVASGGGDRSFGIDRMVDLLPFPR